MSTKEHPVVGASPIEDDRSSHARNGAAPDRGGESNGDSRERPATFTVAPARYAKNRWAVTCAKDGTGLKTDAAHMATVIGGRYSNRERAYIMTSSQLALFRAALAEGWLASSITGQLYRVPEAGAPAYRDVREVRALLRTRVDEERKKIDDEANRLRR